jgi:SAM-dependent methyltransferase
MTGEPQVWHFGLMAERWAEFINDAPEVPYYQHKITQFGQPVLDAACGTGRVLLPLLRAGVDIDGNDISQDMLFQCRKKALAEGLEPTLYNFAMHQIELPRKYRTIFLCDSFGLAGSREKDLETLRRCYQQLEDGGALLVNIDAEYASPESWNLWLKENREKLPEPWPGRGEGRTASDGSEHFGQFRMLEINPLEQSYSRQVSLEKWVNGKLAAAEEYTLHGNMYFKTEVHLMLQVAGFQEISVQGGYTGKPATTDDGQIVFIAVR